MSIVNLLSIVALAPSLALVVLVIVGIVSSLARDASRAYGPRVRDALRRAGSTAHHWFRSLLPPAPARIDLPAARLSRV